MFKSFLFVFALLVFAVSEAGAAEIKMKDGRVLKGTIAARNATMIYVVPDGYIYPKQGDFTTGEDSQNVKEPEWISMAEVESIQTDPILLSARRAAEAAPAEEKTG